MAVYTVSSACIRRFSRLSVSRIVTSDERSAAIPDGSGRGRGDGSATAGADAGGDAALDEPAALDVGTPLINSPAAAGSEPRFLRKVTTAPRQMAT